jgi:hypothetical protein
MRLFHGRWRRETSLLAADALSGEGRAAAERHAASCAECAADLAALREVLAVAARDEACAAEPAVDVRWLEARVRARLDVAPSRTPARRGAEWLAALAAAGVVVAVMWNAATIRRVERPQAVATMPAPQIAVSEDALDRIERTMARERAARYLDEAQDVLVTVAEAPRRCRRADHDHVDMADESRRSRELLTRRAALDLDGSAELAAGPVLDDVERVLRDVASLEGCARRRDVEAIHREVERERLLMRIDLTARELAG